MNEAGCRGNFSNHSLRTTTVNRMIDAGFSDGEIMNRTGHRSSTTIAKYHSINETNAAAASSALTIGGRRQAVQQVLPSSVPVAHTMSSSTSSYIVQCQLLTWE